MVGQFVPEVGFHCPVQDGHSGAGEPGEVARSNLYFSYLRPALIAMIARPLRQAHRLRLRSDLQLYRSIRPEELGQDRSIDNNNAERRSLAFTE